ncbi:MAG: hypothetical protein LBP39_03840 [Rickettsiales bacterium]|jgi:hypothetical protein|nr:hypothetical protein [Rickettsiales bacterium]
MSKFLGWLSDDWQNRRVTFISEAISLFSGIAAASIMSFMLPTPNFHLVYSLYTINAISAIIASVGRKSISFIAVNLFYLFVDIIALYKLFI